MCNCNTKCNNCNQTAPTPCGQTPCQPQQDCSCPVRLNSSCVTYDGLDLSCSGIVSGLDLNATIEALDQYICDAISEINDSINLINVGTGAEVYAGIDAIGRRKIRSLITTGDLLTSVQNTDDITLGIDEDALNDFIQGSTTIVNVGTGAKVYKGFNGISEEHEFRTVIKDYIGVGEELIDSIEVQGDTVVVKGKTIGTTNLIISLAPDGTIMIDSPTSSSNLSFYVDINSVADTETGSLSSPFKTLNKALDKFIGTGTWYNPQYKGYKITLLSNCTLLETSGIDYNGYVNLDINNLNIEGNGFFIGLYANPSPDYYPISTRRMVTDMPKTAGVLNYQIEMNFNNIIFQRIGTNAIVDNLHYSFPTATLGGAFPPLQNGVVLLFTNCTFTNDTSIDSNPNFTTVPNPNDSGNPLVFFGIPVKASNIEPWGVPMMKSEGRNWNKEGFLELRDCRFSNLRGGAMYFKETTYQDYGTFNTFLLNNYTRFYETEVDDFYSPRLGTNLIELEDVNYFRLGNSTYNITVPTMITTEGVPRRKQIGGLESIIKLVNSTFYLDKGVSEEGVENFCQLDGTSAIEIREFRDVNIQCNDVHGFFQVIAPLPLVDKAIFIENSTINEVVVDETGVDKSYIQYLYGYNNTINNAPHSSYLQYVDDIAARAAGLIKGNVYFNITENALKVVN